MIREASVLRIVVIWDGGGTTQLPNDGWYNLFYHGKQ